MSHGQGAAPAQPGPACPLINAVRKSPRSHRCSSAAAPLSGLLPSQEQIRQLGSSGGGCPCPGAVGQAGDTGLVGTRASPALPAQGRCRQTPARGGHRAEERWAPVRWAPSDPLCHSTAPRRGSRMLSPVPPPNLGPESSTPPGTAVPRSAAPRQGPRAGHFLPRAVPQAGAPGLGVPLGWGPWLEKGLCPQAEPRGRPVALTSRGAGLCTPQIQHPPAQVPAGGDPLPPRRGTRAGGASRRRRGGGGGPFSSSFSGASWGVRRPAERGHHPVFWWAPPLSLRLQAARGRANAEAGGEAPPHPVRHRPFKEGEILHINKRGPREQEEGVPVPEEGTERWGGPEPPRNCPPSPLGRAGPGRGFWAGGVLGRGGEP